LADELVRLAAWNSLPAEFRLNNLTLGFYATLNLLLYYIF